MIVNVPRNVIKISHAKATVNKHSDSVVLFLLT